MRVRRIAVLIDGAFFLKRLPKLVEPPFCTTPQQVVETARLMCKRHVLRLTHVEPDDVEGRWLDHVYRLFYYDADPFDGVVHHPLLNKRVDFGKSEVALFRRALFADFRRKRKFALRLGHVSRDSDWSISPRLTRQILKVGRVLECLDGRVQESDASSASSQQLLCELRGIVAAWPVISEGDVILGLRQKGVDMRIGLDIASMTLKHQVDTIVLVTGDSDFVPAAKLARREGVEFLLDPLWQRVSDQLTEHVDGVVSVFPRPVREEALLAA
jgi:uncharacterized LabA/DUF88 family protein